MSADATLSRDQAIKEAIESSNLNALRLSLYMCTKNTELANMRVRKTFNRGGAQALFEVDDQDVPRLKELAHEYLSTRQSTEPWPAYPSKEETRALMDLYRSKEDPTPDSEFQYDYDELAFEEFPREVFWTNGQRPNGEKLSKWKVAIIGAGIAGISAAIQLHRLGIPFVIIERQGEPGGTWARNSYPDCRVDIAADVYQFKFEKNYPWEEHHPSASEKKQYLQYIVQKYGLTEAEFLFHREVVQANWVEEESKWHLAMRHKDGSVEWITTNVVISCTGLFATPNEPNFSGREVFKGHVWHSALWNHNVPYAGKRVAVVGNGSTGTQLAPKVAETAASVTVFQRTPHWVMKIPLYKQKHTQGSRLILQELPFYWHWTCYSAHYTTQQGQWLQVRDDNWIQKGGIFSERNDAARKTITEYIHHKIGHNPELYKKLVPKGSPPYAKRLVVDNGFFDMLNDPRNQLIDVPIKCLTEKGILTQDGKEHEVDIIVLATGFQATNYFHPIVYNGRNGRTFEKEWSVDGARSYLGLTNPGFPNFFSFYGPNHSPRSGGYHSWAGAWTRYTAGLLIHLIENNLHTCEVKQEVYDAYQTLVDENSERLVWSLKSGVTYYQNAQGRPAVNSPFHTYDMYKRLERANLSEFTIE